MARAALELNDRRELVLPADLCRDKHVESGQRFTVVEKGTLFMLVPVPDIRSLRGSAAGARIDRASYRDG